LPPVEQPICGSRLRALDPEPRFKVYHFDMGTLRISEVADRADVPVSTLRYYERVGLLTPPDRSPNGYRHYDESVLEHLAFIGRAKRMGVPLDQVSELIELWSTGGCRPLQARLAAFLAAKIAEVRAQSSELAAFESQLVTLSGRLAMEEGSVGPCDLDCACVRLDPTEGQSDGVCARFPTASRAEAMCTLAPDDRAERVSQWRTLLSAGELHPTGDGLQVKFSVSPGITERLAQLCATEVACCSFFVFEIAISASNVVLVVHWPDRSEAQAVAEAVFGLRNDLIGK
jgi:MerR family transcriptional regulator, copper efflux regulator